APGAARLARHALVERRVPGQHAPALELALQLQQHLGPGGGALEVLEAQAVHPGGGRRHAPRARPHLAVEERLAARADGGDLDDLVARAQAGGLGVEDHEALAEQLREPAARVATVGGAAGLELLEGDVLAEARGAGGRARGGPWVRQAPLSAQRQLGLLCRRSGLRARRAHARPARPQVEPQAARLARAVQRYDLAVGGDQLGRRRPQALVAVRGELLAGAQVARDLAAVRV